MNFESLFVGIVSFLIIGVFHPIVIKAEYYFSAKCWWVFLLAGLLFLFGALFTRGILSIYSLSRWLCLLVEHSGIEASGKEG